MNFWIVLILFVSTAVIGCNDYKPSTKKKPVLKTCEGFATNSFGQQLHWEPKFPIEISVNKSFPSHLMESISKAIENWNEAAQFEVFVLNSELDQTSKAKKDHRNIIYWQNDWDEKKKDLQASTQLYWSGAETHEADILINAKHFKMTDDPHGNEIDLQSLLVHELGHVFGLAHTDEPNSVMGSTLAVGEKRREPSVSDINKLSCRYE